MSARQLNVPPLELWGGVEASHNRLGGLWLDQLHESGHHDRVDDLDRFAEIGISALRQPILWERTERAHGVYDWPWPDIWMERLARLGMRPIVGLVHHGSGPAWTGLGDDNFASGLAAYAAAVAGRYPWVRDWTPVNEPLTTATRCAADLKKWASAIGLMSSPPIAAHPTLSA